MKALKEAFGDETVHMGIDSDYIIKTDNDDILALDVYILYTAGSSSTQHSFYTIDKKDGNAFDLARIVPRRRGLCNADQRVHQGGNGTSKPSEEDGLFFLDGEQEDFDGF